MARDSSLLRSRLQLIDHAGVQPWDCDCRATAFGFVMGYNHTVAVSPEVWARKTQSQMSDQTLKSRPLRRVIDYYLAHSGP